MNFPLEFGIGDYAVSAHLVFEVLGIFFGFRYYIYLRSKISDSINEGNRIWILIGAAFGAMLGSRLIGAFENPNGFVEASNKILYFYTNKTIVGGLFGGLLGVELIKKIIREKESSGDLFVFPLILAICIGRIGCFSSGVHEETYGVPTSLPWGMHLGDKYLRHPVALYEIAFLICLWIALYQIKKSIHLLNGNLFKYFLISYFIFRFFLDFIKPGVVLEVGITTIQLVCLIGLLYYSKTIYLSIFNRQYLLKNEGK